MKITIFLSLLFLCACQAPTPEHSEASEPRTYTTYEAKNNPKGKHIVLVSGDEEYRSEESLPQLAKILSQHHGFDCTVLYAQDPEQPGIINPNYNANITGLEKLEEADMMILFTRWRVLPPEQMQHIDNYLLKGKPLLGIRTSTHAFKFEDDHPFRHYSSDYEGEKTEWKWGFGKYILGETWYTHHGRHKHQSTRGIIAPDAENHPLVNGINTGEMWGATDVYGIRMPIGGDAKSIVLGQTIDRAGEYDETDLFYGMRESDDVVATHSPQGNDGQGYNPNDLMPPIVWTKSYQIPNGKEGHSVTSTIGASTDMLDEEVRRLFVNAVYYLFEMEVPEKAVVDIVGQYSPTPFQFHDDEYWAQKNLRVE